MNHFSTPNRIRFEFPPVDHLPALDAFLVDARAKDYPGKKGGKYQFKNREKALAKAEEIAALVADTQATNTEHMSSALIAECKARGLCHFSLIRKGITDHDSTHKIVLLKEAHALFTETTENSEREPRSIRSILKRINHFCAHFGAETAVSSLTLVQIEAYLNNAKSPGNFNTWRQHVNTFLNFCCTKHRWIPENHVSRISQKKTCIVVEAFTATQIQQLLNATYTLDGTKNAMMRLYVILGVFAGLRPFEAERLLWEDICFEDECISIHKKPTKIKRKPRIVPFTPALKAWLTTIPRCLSGPVYNQANHRNQLEALQEAAGMLGDAWIQDGLRHTYGSARWLLDKDLAKLAKDMGNSPDVCSEYYLSTDMSKEMARAIFAIMPPAP